MVSAFWQDKYRREAGKSWNLFYRRNGTRFFRDRHWTGREFPELLGPGTRTLLEVGCGVGNLVLPLLQENRGLFAYACDFSPRAIELLRADERYDAGRCAAFVADIAAPDFGVPGERVDAVSLVFVLSALPPERHPDVLGRLRGLLVPGGVLLFRDYAANDAAQERFAEDRRLASNLYVRQDGTLACFFEIASFSRTAEAAGFRVDVCQHVHSRTTNVRQGLDLGRTFLQARLVNSEFRPEPGSWGR